MGKWLHYMYAIKVRILVIDSMKLILCPHVDIRATYPEYNFWVQSSNFLWEICPLRPIVIYTYSAFFLYYNINVVNSVTISEMPT